MNILKRPMFFAAIVCATAAAISIFNLTITNVFLLLAIVSILIVIFFKKYKYIVILFTIILFLVSLYFQFKKLEIVNTYDHDTINGTFVVTEEVIDHGICNSVVLKETDSFYLPKNVKIFALDYDKITLKTGDIVNAQINVSAIDDDNEYRLSNYSEGILAWANIENIEMAGRYNVFYRTTYQIRSFVKNTLSFHFDGDVSGLLVALDIGDKTLLSEQFKVNIKTTGISHLVVVSGMHLSIIMSAVFLLFDRLIYNKFIRSIMALMVVFFIFLACGFTMSIIRAGCMFVVACIAPIFNRENDALNSLMTAVAIVLIGSPFAIYNISFQLSVLSTLAIIWVVPFYYRLITKELKINSKLIKVILNILLCSVFAIIFTLPITINTFGFASIVSPLTNLLVTYPTTIALIFSVLGILLSAVPLLNVLSYAMFFVAGACSKLIVVLVNAIAALPITVAVLPKSAVFWAILLIIAVIICMYIYEFKRKRSELNANSI